MSIKIKVIELDRYRDGGTVKYGDEMGRVYYQWSPTKKVYNQIPYSRGGGMTGEKPDSWIKELDVELEVVDKF